MSWLGWSLLMTTCFGLSLAGYQLPGANRESRAVTTFWAMVIQAVLALLIFHNFLGDPPTSLLVTGAIWGLTFPAIMLLQMYAVTHVETTVVFPLTTTTSLVGTILIGLAVFSDQITLVQALGILLTVVTVFGFLWNGGQLRLTPAVIGTGLGIAGLSAFNKLLQKSAATEFNVFQFQAYQYLFAVGVMALVVLGLHRRELTTVFTWRVGRYGLVIGLTGFLGGFALYQALTSGPFPLVTAIQSLYILVIAFVSWLVFREPIPATRRWLIGLAVLAVVLMRLG